MVFFMQDFEKLKNMTSKTIKNSKLKTPLLLLIAVTCIFLTSCENTSDNLLNKALQWLDEYYAKKYKIDENVNYIEPEYEYFDYDIQRENNILTITESAEKDSIDFELYISDHSYGFYHYYVWLPNADKGTLYLKAFEYNHNKRLRIGNTDILIDTKQSGMIKCGPKFFMIHNDLFVSDYLAKVELWYKPENSGKVQKLLTKIYKVAGFID